MEDSKQNTRAGDLPERLAALSAACDRFAEATAAAFNALAAACNAICSVWSAYCQVVKEYVGSDAPTAALAALAALASKSAQINSEREIVEACPDRRARHYALYHKKRRVRKKYRNKIMREYWQQGGAGKCKKS